MRVPSLAPGPEWLAVLRARADCGPERPRLPIEWNGLQIGSAEPQVLAAIAGRRGRASVLQQRDSIFEIVGPLTPALAEVAFALRDAGFVTAWRNEELAVPGPDGSVLGTVERGVVRLLGVATQAVHLLGFDAAGNHWLQQRAFDKPDDPGLWDTLMGGMVGAGESVQQTLERETWEEAGLKLSQLARLAHGGRATIRRPSANVPHGYVVERITWYRCVLPEGVEPANMDGEVEQFRRMPPAEVTQALARGEFTTDASVLLMESAGEYA